MEGIFRLVGDWRVLVFVLLVIAILATTVERVSAGAVYEVAVRYIGTTAWAEGDYLNIPPDVAWHRLGPVEYTPAYAQYGYGVEWDRPIDFLLRVRNTGKRPVWVRVTPLPGPPWQEAWAIPQDVVVLPGRTAEIAMWMRLNSAGFETDVRAITMCVGSGVRLRVTEIARR